MLVWFWIALGVCVVQSKSLDQSPSWSQEVVTDLSRTRNGIRPLLLDGNRAGVTFLDDKQLIAYEVDRDSRQLSSRDSPEVSSPFRLRVSILDAKSGKITLTKDWGTRVGDSAVLVTIAGVLVKTGEIVRSYSPDLTKFWDLALPLDKDSRLILSVSPTGKTIMINRLNQKLNVSHFHVFDASTLKARFFWDQSPPLYHNYSISDEGIAALNSNDHSVVVTEFGSTKWDAPGGRSKSGCFATSPTLVTNELLVVQQCQDLLLQTTAGVSYSLRARDGDRTERAASTQCVPYDGRMLDKTAVASEGRFVARSLPNVKIRKHLLTEPSVCLTGLQVAVYDLTQKRRIFTVNVEPLPKNDYDFAVSPDGSMLAVLNDRNVSVYSVPMQSSEHTTP